MFASDKNFFQYKMALMTLTIMMMATTMILRIMRGGQWHHIILGTNQNSSPITLTALIIGTNHKTDFDGICDYFFINICDERQGWTPRGEGGVPRPALPRKNDQIGGDIAGQNKGPKLNFL